MSKWLIPVAIAVVILVGCDTPPQELAARQEPTQWEVLGRQGQGAIFIAIDPAVAGNRDVYRRAVAGECPPEWCQAMFWAKGTAVAHALPLSDAQVRDQLVVYNRNLATGLSRYVWRCDVFSEVGPNECFTPD